MEFWLIMIAFIVMGGSCSLAGTWWDRKNKKDKKEEKKQKETSGTPSQAAKTYTVSFTVPGSGSAKQVKIVASDATSSRVLYSGSAAPGTRLRETVTLGQDASVQFYVNGALVEDRSL